MKKVTGKRHWERDNPDGEWYLKCEQWYHPRQGIQKIVNNLGLSGNTENQIVCYELHGSMDFEPISKQVDAYGVEMFSLYTCVLIDDQTGQIRGRISEYRRPDGSRICELETEKDSFRVAYYDEAGNETKEYRRNK